MGEITNRVWDVAFSSTPVRCGTLVPSQALKGPENLKGEY